MFRPYLGRVPLSNLLSDRMARQQSDILETRVQLLELHKRQESPRKRSRIEMLLLLHDHPDRALADIAREIECAERSVLRWWRQYLEGGIDKLLADGHKGRPSRLATSDIDEIRAKIAENGLSGVEQIRGWLSEEYGLDYSKSGVWYILREVLGAKRNNGWLLLDDGEKPADSGDSLALDNVDAVISLLNALPMTDDVIEWGNGFRGVLHRILPDFDRITVTVNLNCDLKQKERNEGGWRLSSFLDVSKGDAQDLEFIGAGRMQQSPSDRLLDELKRKGLPLHEFHRPVIGEFFHRDAAYLGCILLWTSRERDSVNSVSTERFEKLRPFVLFAISSFVARYQAARPVAGAFHSALGEMTEDAGLTPSERRIVTLLLLGNPYKEIADIMTVSLDAVKKHLHLIYKKTKTRGQAELFSKYFSARLRREQSESAESES